MSDKDLLAAISEMLRKQDQHSEILNKQSEILDKHSEILSSHTEILNSHTEILNGHTRILEKQADTLEVVSSTLSNFMNVSIKQFEQQQVFNEKFVSQNEKIVSRLDSIEKLLTHMVDMDERLKRLEAVVFK